MPTETTYQNWEFNWKLIYGTDNLNCGFCYMILMPVLKNREVTVFDINMLVRKHGFYCTQRPEYLNWKTLNSEE